jgi:hypothetical protein
LSQNVSEKHGGIVNPDVVRASAAGKITFVIPDVTLPELTIAPRRCSFIPG